MVLCWWLVVGLWLVSSCSVIVLVQLMIRSVHKKQKSCGTLLVAGCWFVVGQFLSSPAQVPDKSRPVPLSLVKSRLAPFRFPTSPAQSRPVRLSPAQSRSVPLSLIWLPGRVPPNGGTFGQRASPGRGGTFGGGWRGGWGTTTHQGLIGGSSV